MSIWTENVLFDWRVSQIDLHAKGIESATHLFDGRASYDTALDRFDLRMSAKRLREAADKLDGIAGRLATQDTAFAEAAE